MASPPRVLVPETSLEPGARHRLDGDMVRHLVTVLRLRPRDPVIVLDRDGQAFRARVERERDGWWLAVLAPEPHDRAVREAIRIRLIVGLLKSNRTEWAVQKATELGVSEVRVVGCERSVPRLAGGDATDRVFRLYRVAREAAQQCGRATVPGLSWRHALASALADLPAGGLRFCLEESPGTRPLAVALAKASEVSDVTLAVGPEGSFSPAEREALAAAGFEPAGLGPRVLRAETAAVVGVAVVQAVLGDLSGKVGPQDDREGA